MAPARGTIQDNPIVLGEDPLVFDLKLSDNEEMLKVDGDDDLLELSDSPAARQRAQNRRKSTGIPPNSYTSLYEPDALQGLSTSRNLSGEPASATNHDQRVGTPTGKQQQDDQNTTPPDTPPTRSECTFAPKTDPVNAASPTDIESGSVYDSSRTGIAPAETIELPVVSLIPDAQNSPALEPELKFIQTAVMPRSDPEHHARASGVEEKREQTLSELITTNPGLTMSDRVSSLDAPSMNGESTQAFVSSRKQKAIKSVKSATRPRFLTRPREKTSQRILGTPDETKEATTPQPLDTQSCKRKPEAEPVTERDLSKCGSLQETIAPPRISDTTPPTVSPSAPFLSNVEPVNQPQPLSQDPRQNVEQLTSSASLTATNKQCADFGEGHWEVLIDPIQNTMEDELQKVQRCLHRHLDERHGTHAYLTRATLQRHRTCQERDVRAQARRQELPTQCISTEKPRQTISPFEGMMSIQTPSKRISGRLLKTVHHENFFTPGVKTAVVKSSWRVQSVTHASDAVVIPPFKEYVTLKKSILSDNESKLLTTPFVDDLNGPHEKELRRKLPQDYIISHDENANLEFRSEQRLFYKNVAESFWKELDVSWNDILFWLLASKESLLLLNRANRGYLSYESVISDRSDFEKETFIRDGNNKKLELFDRTDQKWQKLLLSLQQPDANKLRSSALACNAFLTACGFNVWYLAQQCDIIVSHISQKIRGSTDTHQPTFRAAMCRVCYEHNCPLHGEIREHPTLATCSEETGQSQETAQSDDEQDGLVGTQSSDTKMPAHVNEDSDVENSINYRILANADAPNEYQGTFRSRKPPETFKAAWWKNNSTTAWDYRNPFFPCNHEGRCDEAKCRCYRENITCEKTCKCSMSCNRRFPGCSGTCTLAPNRRVCENKKCLCVWFERECDADICGTCGATEVLDPVNRYNENVLKAYCSNVSIQRGVPSKTLLGHSEVHGFGLYCGEAIKKGGFICEYTGETVSKSESDRRHTIYEYQKTTYTFALNKIQDVDATYMGNKTRFINNADTNLANCHAKNLMCNTVQRIGMYASVDMQPGTELFFHYNYTKEQMKGFKQPKAQIVAVKQTTKHTKTRPELGVTLSSSDDGISEVAGHRNRKTTTKTRAAKNVRSPSLTSSLSSVQDFSDENDEEDSQSHSLAMHLAMEIRDTEDEVGSEPDAAESAEGSGSESEIVQKLEQYGMATRGRGGARTQPDQVVAVKQRGKLWNGASRKRKR